jgi:hypothetical protein
VPAARIAKHDRSSLAECRRSPCASAREQSNATRDARIAFMKFFVKAVVTGFALSLGSALFKKVQRHLGLGDDKEKDKDKATAEVVKQDGATDPNLQQPRYS